jgi:hypothetical protein
MQDKNIFSKEAEIDVRHNAFDNESEEHNSVGFSEDEEDNVY